jgi:hypothetical protein
LQVAGARLYPSPQGATLVADRPGNAFMKAQPIPCQGHPIKLASLTLQIEPIPVGGRTRDFSGGVGPLSATLKSEAIRVPLGNTFKVELRLEGPGAFGVGRAPALRAPDKALEVRGWSQVFDALTQTRIFTYELRARKAGSWTIPAPSIVTFRPATGNFETVRPHSLHIEVLAGEMLGLDQVTYGRPGPARALPPKFLWTPLVLIVCGVIGWFLQTRYQRGTALRAWRATCRRALNRLRSLETNTPSDLAGEVERIVSQLLGPGDAAGTLTPDEAALAARTRGANETTTRATFQLFEACVWWRCSEEGTRRGELPDIEACQELADKARQLVRQLSRCVRR